MGGCGREVLPGIKKKILGVLVLNRSVLGFQGFGKRKGVMRQTAVFVSRGTVNPKDGLEWGRVVLGVV